MISISSVRSNITIESAKMLESFDICSRMESISFWLSISFLATGRHPEGHWGDATRQRLQYRPEETDQASCTPSRLQGGTSLATEGDRASDRSGSLAPAHTPSG